MRLMSQKPYRVKHKLKILTLCFKKVCYCLSQKDSYDKTYGNVYVELDPP
jgi:hypothetical protein